MVYWYDAHVFSKCLWNSPSRPYYYWYHLCYYIPHIIIIIIIIIIMARDSSVGITTRYGPDGSEIESR